MWNDTATPFRAIRVALVLAATTAGCGSGTATTPSSPAPVAVQNTGEDAPDAPAREEESDLAVEDDAALRARCNAEWAAALNEKSVAESMAWLRDRMYVIGETTGSLDDWQGAIACVAMHVFDRVSDPAHQEELLAEVSPGATPLAFASLNGYPAVVHVLLRFEPVRAHIEDAGPYGLTPWQLSNLAPSLTMLVLNSTLTADPFRFVPFAVKVPYYGDETLRPYHLVRQLLQEAGAETDVDPVKTVIRDLPGCPAPIKERVRATDDVLTTLRDAVLNDEEHGLPSLQRR